MRVNCVYLEDNSAAPDALSSTSLSVMTPFTYISLNSHCLGMLCASRLVFCHDTAITLRILAAMVREHVAAG